MLLAVLLILGAHAHDAGEPVQPYPWGDDDDDGYLYHNYNEKAIFSSTKAMTTTQETQITRVRRNDQTTVPIRTLSPDEIREVKGVLNKMMAGRDLRMLTTDSVTDLRRLVDLISSPTPDLMSDLARFTLRSTPLYDEEESKDLRQSKKDLVTFHHWVFERVRRKEIKFDTAYVFPIEKDWVQKKYHLNKAEFCAGRCIEIPQCESFFLDNYYHTCMYFKVKRDKLPRGFSFPDNKYCTYYGRMYPEPTTTVEPTTDNSTTTLEITTQPQIIDIRKLVQIIANLTMNTIESNLTELFNATLQKYGIPMCGDVPPTEEPSYDFANATIVSKCFVCGLDIPGIPHNAFCSDAFAGDFIPLVPVDPRAKGQIARYRKYCRYLDVPGTIINETQPRSVFGRWTGGCSVRWIDLSGVYTQRACRNRRHAVMGEHYVSKRMAKLEMALKNEDNGCIISPMSSLVPLSRGISLYARFHACVCTGNWCNDTPRVQPIQLTAFAVLATMAIMA